MNKPKSSLIMSPNLGCPEIVGRETISKKGFRVIIAAPVSEDFDDKAHSLSATPSFQGDGQEFALELVCIEQFPTPKLARKLEDEALPLGFKDVSETRLLISTKLRTELFPQHAFWEVRVKPKTSIEDKHFRTAKGGRRSTLYNLELKVGGIVVGRVKHALCLRVDDAGVKFVHLTDLHVAARNDMWEGEVPAVIEGSPVTPGRQNFQNFNERLREFIRSANQAADEGKLDFIWVLGDLVDFCRTGLFDRMPDDSNWPALIEILTGSEAERQRCNNGLRVPIFTTTGNHDWRTYPYSPVFRLDIFGITKKCAKELDFWYRNTSVEIGKKLEEVQQKLIRTGSPLLARSWWGAITSMLWRGIAVGAARLGQRAAAIGVKYARTLVWLAVAAWFGAGNLKDVLARGPKCIAKEFVARANQWLCHPSPPSGGAVVSMAVVIGALIFTFAAPAFLNSLLRPILEGLISIEAEVSTLSEYFLRVNPYFNYAFQLENCYFVVLDTGPDCLTAQSFWDGGGKKVRNISISDNILGGSPDTMGFYPANEFYPYSQISWLERVLSCIGAAEQPPPERRVFVGLHAPPANLSPVKREQAKEQLERNAACGRPEVLMEEAPFGGCDWLDGYDIRYGTVNHYLSQFFYLCLGYRESEQDKRSGPGIDAVFAGHAHWNMEFELRKPKPKPEPTPEPADPRWWPEVWYGRFSLQVEEKWNDPQFHWGPLLLQTAACGPQGAITSEVPPNYRYVTVDGTGAVRSLRPKSLVVRGSLAGLEGL